MTTNKHVHGDIVKQALAGEFDVIVHGCNCFNTMGKGLALTIKRHFPLAYQADQKTLKGDRKKLGTLTTAFEHNVHVVNAYTQYHYGAGQRQADYEAIRACMADLKKRFTGKRIGLPLIGAGLAGGDWAMIQAIISEELDGEDVTIVHYAAPTVAQSLKRN